MKKGLTLGLLLMTAGFLWGCKAKTQNPAVLVEPRQDDLVEIVDNERMQLDYATEFSVEYDKNGCVWIETGKINKYLLVPKGVKVPEDISEDVAILQQPVENIYLCATASMNLFTALDAIDAITLSGTKEDGWYIDEAIDAMRSGKMKYAGKYSAPDYELILNSDCDLAVESQMIYHTPEVKEKLEMLGIPVFVDYSSNEKEPLGRAEWIKLYGLLVGKEELASQLFEEQKKAFEAVRVAEKTGKTVAFFSINSNGSVSVRKANDYIPKLIDAAGGTYVLESMVDDEKGTSTVNMQMENFYEKAIHADYIIYNSTITGEMESVEALLERSELMKDFDAVKNGKVFCLTKNLYQESLNMGMLTKDISIMLTKEDAKDEEFTFLFRLQ